MKFFKNTCVVASVVFSVFFTSSSFANNSQVVEDSTALNAKDATGETKTPLDQLKGSEKDIETTRQIRQALMADEALSTNARNVKVITLKNKVTIRGAVNSSAELQRVLAVAKKSASRDSQVVHDLNIVK